MTLAKMNELRKFRNAHEAILAYDYGQIKLQEKIQVQAPPISKYRKR